MTPEVLNPLVHLRRLGGVGPYGGDQPSGTGDLTSASGLALRSEGGTLYAVIRGWANPAPHLEYEIPVTWDGNTPTRVSGAMKFRRNLGVLSNMGAAPWGGGVYIDPGTGLYFSNRTGEYDTDPTISPTSFVGTLSATGKLVPRHSLIFSIGDKRTQTCCRIPRWFSDEYLEGGGDWYAACGGGAKSGNFQYASLMPSVVAFRLPEGSGTQQVPCKELSGATVSVYQKDGGRQQTTPMRWQELPANGPESGGWPSQPYLTGGPGYWSNGHSCHAGMTWVDAPGVSGCVFYLCEPCQSSSQETANKPGCEWYGHNDGSAAPCAGWAGNKATINSSARRPVLYVTDWHDLAAVARGERRAKDIQAQRYDWNIPGIVIPTRGLPAQDRDGKGVSSVYDEVHGVTFYGLMISGGQLTNGTFNNWPIIHLYEVVEGAGPTISAPAPPSNVRVQ